MANFTEHEEGFLNAIIYHINKDWKGEKGKFAEKMGISGSYVSFMLGRKKCPIVKKQEIIAKNLKYKTLTDMVEFGKNLTTGDLVAVMPQFQMQGQTYSPPPPEPRYSEKIPPPDCNLCSLKEETVKRHAIVIEGFDNQELATEINQYLVEIEKLEGTNGLNAIKKYIAYQLNEAREKKGIAPLQKTGTGSGGQ